MAPHCDTMDGPVVKAAKRALESNNVNLILAWVHKESEAELKQAFKRTQSVRETSGDNLEGTELADLWFFETAVRLHRAGEGAPYAGIKPAGLLESPAIPMADEAVETENPDKVIGFLVDSVKEELSKRFKLAVSKKRFDENDVGAAREYVQAMLGFVLFAGHLHDYVKSGGRSHDNGIVDNTEHSAKARDTGTYASHAEA
jgi:hypothetical protein